MADPQTLEEIGKVLETAFANGGWLALLGGLLTLSIRVLRWPQVQAVLGWVSPKTEWDNWPLWLRRLLPFALPLIGGVLTALSQGLGLIAAVVAGVVAAGVIGSSSLVAHKGTKKIGDMEARLKVRKDINYRPGTLRKAASLVVPIEGAVRRAKKANGVLG